MMLCKKGPAGPKLEAVGPTSARAPNAPIFPMACKLVLPAVIAALALPLSSAQPTASCATNHTPCPAPLWEPVWNLTMSTICQPSSVGYFIPPVDKPWGLVSLDWSVARSIWNKNGSAEGTIEATSIEGCRLIKQASPATKCMIYHNMELASVPRTSPDAPRAT